MSKETAQKSNTSGARTLLSIAGGFVFLGGLVVTLLYTVFGTVVPPDSIGVRINYFSFGVLEQGYSRDGLRPGLHLKFPGVSDIVLIPRGIQFINLGVEFTKGKLDLPPLQVQSANGPRLNTGVTLVVRLFEDQDGSGLKEIKLEPAPKEGPMPLPVQQKISHGGPADLITYFGFDPLGQLAKLARIAQNELGKALNVLSSSDFYNPLMREDASLKAHQAINRLVNPYGVEVWGTLVRRYTYEKEEIDNQIFAKNLQTQTARLRTAQTALAEVTAQIDKTKEFWFQKIKEKNVEAESYLLRKEAEAKFLEETKVAEGEMIYRTKLAGITSQKNRLLAEVPGAEIYIARQMVPLLKTLSGGIVNNVDPYDVDAWLNKLTGLARGEGK